MSRSTGLSALRAAAKASSLQGNQWIGWWAAERRYDELAVPRRLAVIPEGSPEARRGGARGGAPRPGGGETPPFFFTEKKKGAPPRPPLSLFLVPPLRGGG